MEKMAPKANRVITVDLDDKLHKQAKMIGIMRNLKWKTILTEALEAWVKKNEGLLK